jgi:hypothetical protein
VGGRSACPIIPPIEPKVKPLLEIGLAEIGDINTSRILIFLFLNSILDPRDTTGSLP